MLKIKDNTHNLTYTFTLKKVLIDIEENHISIWDKESNRLPYIPENVLLQLKTI